MYPTMGMAMAVWASLALTIAPVIWGGGDHAARDGGDEEGAAELGVDGGEAQRLQAQYEHEQLDGRQCRGLKAGTVSSPPATKRLKAYRP